MAAIFSRAVVGLGVKSSNLYISVSRKNLLCGNYVTTRYILNQRLYSKDLPAINEAELYETNEDDEVAEEREIEIQEKRNKSRLSPSHYNILHGKVPYDEPKAWFHNSVKYKKRMFGRYGLKSDVPLGILWRTKSELEDLKEYENVKYPDSLQTMMKRVSEKKRLEEENIQKRQADISAKFAKLEQWKKELHTKVEKKAKEAEVSRLKKERLVEEVRRHFGYNVDPREDKFKEMLEQKEKQEKKLEKDARKKAKQDKMMQKLIQKSSEESPA